MHPGRPREIGDTTHAFGVKANADDFASYYYNYEIKYIEIGNRIRLNWKPLSKVASAIPRAESMTGNPISRLPSGRVSRLRFTSQSESPQPSLNSLISQRRPYSQTIATLLGNQPYQTQLKLSSTPWNSIASLDAS